MKRRSSIAALICWIALGITATAQAQEPEPPPPVPDVRSSNTAVVDAAHPQPTIVEVDSDAAGGTVGARVTQLGAGARATGPVSISSGGAPRCSHRPAKYGEYPNVVPDGSTDIPDPDAQTTRTNNGRTETGWVRTCNAGNSEDPFYWAPANIDPIDLIPNALANARTRLAAPSPAINPTADAGGIVNLGMWLAINDPGPTTARASLANVWAQVNANVASITTNFGNGDIVECEGLGTPIPDWAWDETDEGPCGYTYLQSSPDDEPYLLTITTNYAITYSTSSGANGTLDAISRSTTVAYNVDEIQTIGVSN